MAVRHKVGTIAGTMAVSLAFFSGTANAQALSFNQRTSSYVENFTGRVPYVYGGSSPSSGFDCSGLAQYVYHHFGKSIPRTADAQFRQFRRAASDDERRDEPTEKEYFGEQAAPEQDHIRTDREQAKDDPDVRLGQALAAPIDPDEG